MCDIYIWDLTITVWSYAYIINKYNAVFNLILHGVIKYYATPSEVGLYNLIRKNQKYYKITTNTELEKNAETEKLNLV